MAKILTEIKFTNRPFISENEYNTLGSFGIFVPNNNGDTSQDQENFNNVEKRSAEQLLLGTNNILNEWNGGLVADEFGNDEIKYYDRDITIEDKPDLLTYQYLNIKGILKSNPYYEIDGVHTPDETAYFPDFTQMYLKKAIIEIAEAFNSGWRPHYDQLKTFNTSAGNNVGASQSSYKYTDFYEQLPNRAKIYILQSQLFNLDRDPDFVVKMAGSNYPTWEEIILWVATTEHINLMSDYDLGLLTQQDFNEYIFEITKDMPADITELQEELNDLQIQADDNTAKIELLSEADGTKLEVAVISKILDNSTYPVGVSGDIKVEVFQQDLANSEIARIKYPIDVPAETFDIIHNVNEAQPRDFIKIDFGISWESVINPRAEGNVDFTFTLKDVDGNIKDKDNNDITLHTNFVQDSRPVAHFLSNEFELDNTRDYLGCYWELHFVIDNTIAQTEPLTKMRQYANNLEYLGQAWNASSFENAVKTQTIDTLGDKSVVDSINDSILAIADVANVASVNTAYRVSQKINVSAPAVPITLGRLPGTTKTGAGGSTFGTDWGANPGSTQNGGNNTSEYLDMLRINTRGSTTADPNGLTPYLNKDLNALNAIFNAPTKTKFGDLPQLILPILWPFYDPANPPTEVGMMEHNVVNGVATITVSKVPFGSITNDYNKEYATIFRLNDNGEGKTLKIRPKDDQSGMTYTQKLAWRNANVYRHNSTTEGLHFIIDVNTEEVLAGIIQPAGTNPQWDDPNCMWLNGYATENKGIEAYLTPEQVSLYKDRDLMVGTIWDGIATSVRANLFEAVLSDTSVNKYIAGINTDNKPYLVKSDGNEMLVDNIATKSDIEGYNEEEIPFTRNSTGFWTTDVNFTDYNQISIIMNGGNLQYQTRILPTSKIRYEANKREYMSWFSIIGAWGGTTQIGKTTDTTESKLNIFSDNTSGSFTDDFVPHKILGLFKK